MLNFFPVIRSFDSWVFRLLQFVIIFFAFHALLSTKGKLVFVIFLLGLFPVSYGAIKFANLESRQRYPLIDADMRGADLRNMKTWYVDHRWADMREADLSGVELSRVDFYRAHLDQAKLEGAELRHGSFREATLNGTDMTAAILTSANFQNAEMFGAQLETAWLFDVDLTGAIGLMPDQLKDACLFGNTLLPDDEPIWTALANGTLTPLTAR